MTDIRRARFPEDREAVIAIFREYIGSTSVSLDFQDYEDELAGLPGKYDAPHGGLFLAWDGAAVVGCAGFRAVDDRVCEMKRVYVRPVARGRNLGRRLVERILAEGCAAGYTRICLDVLPEFDAALRLYESLGFVPAPPVTFNPVAGTRFLGLDLSPRKMTMTEDTVRANFWNASNGRCDCCGNESWTIWGDLADASGTKAAYFVQWTVDRPEHMPHVDLVVGPWGAGATAADRVLVSLDYRPRPGGGAFMVVSGKGRRGDDRTLCARALGRDEVIGTPLAAEVFALVDALWLTEPRLEHVRELDALAVPDA